MAWHSLKVQKLIIDTLLADDEIELFVADRIYDDVPETATFPFIAYRDISSTDFGVKDKDAQEIEIQIDVWSEYRGTKETKEIMVKVRDLLHNASVSLTDAALVNIREVFSTVLIDAEDGITRHGIMRFRVVVFDN